MKKIIHITMSALLAFSLFSCEREFVNDIESTTPPELHVFAQDAEGDPIEGADVTLYSNEEDYTGETNAVATKETDGEGKAVFAESELTEPGVFYVRAVSGALNNSGSQTATPYLLLNDGHTHFYTTLE